VHLSSSPRGGTPTGLLDTAVLGKGRGRGKFERSSERGSWREKKEGVKLANRSSIPRFSEPVQDGDRTVAVVTIVEREPNCTEIEKQKKAAVYSSSAGAAAAFNSLGFFAASPQRPIASSLLAPTMSHLSCSIEGWRSAGKRGRKRERETNVLCLGNAEDDDGKENTPDEGLASGGLGEAEVLPDVRGLRTEVGRGQLGDYRC
jgi:hypothetical protein